MYREALGARGRERKRGGEGERERGEGRERGREGEVKQIYGYIDAGTCENNTIILKNR